MNPILEITKQGQSIWYDYIQRGMIWTGTLYRMMREDGLRGVTSNPAIFEKAIGGSRDYTAAVKGVVRSGASPIQTFERVAIHDIQLATDVLRAVYDDTKGRDGYVSFEVAPNLAADTEGTLRYARRVWQTIDRENLMVKIPATPEGIPAIEQAIAEGINVNVTLLFAVEAYEKVHEAYISGLEKLVARGGDPSRVASVASFFVSRIDTLVDKMIDDRLPKAAGPEKEKLEALRGKVAIANAKIAYQSYLRTIQTPRWKALEARGARTQRLLWASTGTKNPAYRDVVYVEELIGSDTVNTVPEATYNAFKDHGRVRPSLTENVEEAKKTMAALETADISMKTVTDRLLVDGVALFRDAFDRLLTTVEKRRREILGVELGRLEIEKKDEKLEATLDRMRVESFTHRLWDKDPTLWSKDPKDAKGISGFMGWLRSIEDLLEHHDAFAALSQAVAKDGIETVLLMGMGGSSLAPEVFARTFGRQKGHPELLVLDSTVPAQVAAIERRINPERTLFIVSSKSGSTTEPLVFDKYFFEKVKKGERFVAVTDPGSKLEAAARARCFRQIIPGDPEIGGRYSALSPFGIVAAQAMGLDTIALLKRARRMQYSCQSEVPPAENPGVRLGTFVGLHALAGRDKLTVATTPALSAFGAWLEQLIAESTGKQGKGVVPVDGERLGAPEVYGKDRVFAYLKLAGDPDRKAVAETEQKLAALSAAGHPVVTFEIATREDIGQEMFLWEIATATIGHILQINPFDQPNVQESKDYTADLLASYTKNGRLPEIPGEVKIFEGGGVTVFTDERNAKDLPKGAASLEDVLGAHLGRTQPGDYVAFNAYLEMNSTHEAALQAIRHRVRDARRVATTLGFGPRFLHSTGQLHKGGASTGVFLQITANDPVDLGIPGEKFTFGVLKSAQEAGDFMALSKRGRRLVRVHLADVGGGLKALDEAL